MKSVYDRLVMESSELVLLFTPPFDQTTLDPGYIKAYLPGVRENGGQYTHAGAWTIIASAMQADGNRAFELFSFLNPIHHSKNISQANRYKIEPYVAAGDVYSVAPNDGRGGWSWYTGAAAWMYRAGIEFILGFKVSGNEVIIKPCVPDTWRNFSIRYRHKESAYIFNIEIRAGAVIQEQKVKLESDGQLHEINVRF